MQPRVPLYRQAQEQLKRYIEAHNLVAGDALPSEGMLAGELGMSRLSLREATKSLEALGIVEARHGEGIFVKPFTFEPILNNLPYGLFVYGRSLQDLFLVRRGLEAGLIGLVADRVSPSDLDALDVLVEQMAAHARRGEPIVAPDRAFHLALFRPLDNPLVLRLIELFWDAYHRLRRETHPTPSDPVRVHRIHAAVVGALRSGDRQAAVEALDHHFAVIPPGIPDIPGVPGGLDHPDVPKEAPLRTAEGSPLPGRGGRRRRR